LGVIIGILALNLYTPAPWDRVLLLINLSNHASVAPLSSSLLTLYCSPCHAVFGIENKQSRSLVVR